jgi:hypothetical protein
LFDSHIAPKPPTKIVAIAAQNATPVIDEPTENDVIPTPIQIPVIAIPVPIDIIISLKYWFAYHSA